MFTLPYIERQPTLHISFAIYSLEGLFLIMIYGGLVDDEQPFQERWTMDACLILHDSTDSNVVTDINVDQIISPQCCCFLSKTLRKLKFGVLKK